MLKKFYLFFGFAIAIACIVEVKGLAFTNTRRLPRGDAIGNFLLVVPTNNLQQQRRKWQNYRENSEKTTTQLSLSTSSCSGGSKEEEIAKLEEQLRRLKEEAEQEQQVSVAASGGTEEYATATSQAVTSIDGYVGRGPAKRPVKPTEEMLSEAWKEGDSASEQGGLGSTLTTVLGTIAFVVILGLFSQVPLGQEDLSKYQAIKTSTQLDLGDLNPVRSFD